MTFGKHNGRPPDTTVIRAAQAAKISKLRRHPYGAGILVVTAATLCVFIVERLAGFPPLIILAGAPAVCFVTLGVRPGLLTVLLSAVASDFFFIEPLLTVTRYSLLLAACYSVAALVSQYVAGNHE